MGFSLGSVGKAVGSQFGLGGGGGDASLGLKIIVVVIFVVVGFLVIVRFLCLRRVDRAPVIFVFVGADDIGVALGVTFIFIMLTVWPAA